MKLLTGILIGILISVAIFFGYFQFEQQKIALSGNIISEKRQVSGFNKLSILGSGTVTIEQGDQEALTVEADEKLMPHIKTEVLNNELQLKVDYRTLFSLFSLPSHDIQYYLTVTDLSQISINGSGKLISPHLSTSELELKVNGSGNAKMNLSTGKLTIKSSGSGTFTLTGIADQQIITMNGSGSFDGKDLKGQSAEISISGSGKGIINATDRLDVKISGSGKIQYIGEPTITQNISGSGSISQIKIDNTIPVVLEN